MTFYESGQQKAHQSGWHSKEEAWRYAREEDPTRRATVADKKQFMAGWKSVRTPKRSRNPLPVGKFVSVKAKRLRNGRVEIYLP